MFSKPSCQPKKVVKVSMLCNEILVSDGKCSKRPQVMVKGFEARTPEYVVSFLR